MSFIPPSVFPRLLDSRHLTDALNKDPRQAAGIALVYLGGGMVGGGGGQTIPTSFDISKAIDLERSVDLIGTPITIPGPPPTPGTPTGTVAFIKHYHLFTQVTDGVNLDIDLSQYGTLNALIAAINAVPGYQAVLMTGADPQASPLSLIDVDEVDIAISIRFFYVSTSLLWSILRPVAWALEDAYVNMFNGFSEADIATADGPWLDVWGELMGDVERNPGELDPHYSTRVLKEIFRHRLTPLALQLIIQQDTGIQVTVTGNRAAETEVIGQSLVGDNILADRLHSRTVFFVNIPSVGSGGGAFVAGYPLDESPSIDTEPNFDTIGGGTGGGLGGPGSDVAAFLAVQALVDRNRMAGTLPIIGTLTSCGIPTWIAVPWAKASIVRYQGYCFRAAAAVPFNVAPIFASLDDVTPWDTLTSIDPLTPYPWFVMECPTCKD